MIRVLFFAKLRESLGRSDYSLDGADAPLSVETLRDKLLSEQPAWLDALCAPNVIVALNQEVASLDATVNDGDEVAFYPPVTGG